MMIELIVTGVMGVLFAVSLIWYRMKLHCLNFKGRTEAVITKISEYSRRDDKKRKQYFYQYTAEYYVEDKAYKLRRTVPKKDEMYEGYRIDVAYDEKAPRRCVPAEEITVPETAVRKWKLVPIAAGIFWIVVFIFLIPMIFGFSERNSDIYEDGIRYAMMLACAGSVVWKFGAKDIKQHGFPWRTLFVLLFWIALLIVYFWLVFSEYFA